MMLVQGAVPGPQRTPTPGAHLGISKPAREDVLFSIRFDANAIQYI